MTIAECMAASVSPNSTEMARDDNVSRARRLPAMIAASNKRIHSEQIVGEKATYIAPLDCSARHGTGELW
jgi:hypothetical protein